MSESFKEALAHNDPMVEVGHGHEQEAHSVRLYAMILGALLVLTVITVAASRIQFGSGMANVIVALTIATIKASLVALYFMHLRYDRPLNAVIFCTSLAFLAIFLISCYTDQQTRHPLEPNSLKADQPILGGANAPKRPPAAGGPPSTAPAAAPASTGTTGTPPATPPQH